MALSTCRECGKEVSTEAKACPNCGATSPTLPNNEPVVVPPEKKKSSGLLKPVLYVAGIGLVAAIVMPMLGGKQPSTSTPKSSSKSAQDDVCRDKGDALAQTYISNIEKLTQAGIVASQVMNEGCQKNAGSGGEECVKLCQDGFKYRAKKWVKN